ncbi:MAG: trypsin-like serine protease [Deltaproteobacteria bacterium]|nr:trypsin-like serine protease [Deltaproteobacteria bacterium]
MKSFDFLVSASVLSVFIAAGAGACDVGSDRAGGSVDSRVTDDGDASIEEFPWQVSIQRAGGAGEHLCGGAIIEGDSILTAAHCVHNRAANSLQVVAGISARSETDATGQIRRVEEIVVFPGYKNPQIGGDIALLRLSSELDLTGPRASFIALATPAETDSMAPGLEAQVSGWGLDEAEVDADGLEFADVVLLSADEASSIYDLEVNPEQLTVVGAPTGRRLCEIDGGSPLVVDSAESALLVGVGSWTTRCSDGKAIGIYTRVSSYGDWLTTVLDKAPKKPGSCESRCGRRSEGAGACRCDDLCVKDGGCCSDYQEQCTAG